MALAAMVTLAPTPVTAIDAGAAYDLIEENGAGPIDPIVQSKSPADSVSVLVKDAAIVTQSLVDEAHPNRGVVKETTSDTEFSQFALIWAGDPDIASFIRVERADGPRPGWSSTDPGYPVEDNGNGLNGTELIYIEPTKHVQVSIHGFNTFGPSSSVDLKDIKGAEKLDLSRLNLDEISAEGAKKAVEDAKDSATDVTKDVVGAASGYQQTPNIAPGDALDGPTTPSANDTANLDSSNLLVKWTDIESVTDGLPINRVDAVLIDGQAAVSGIDPIVDAEDVAGVPEVITHAGQGTNENNRCKGADYNSKLVSATVHHTASSSNYTESQSAGVIRGTYQYHAQTLGWCDIGYNTLVDEYGNVYESRYDGLDKNVQGAHTGDFNIGTFGISVMGNYSSAAPSEAALNSMGSMIGWRLKIASIKLTSQIQVISGGTSYSKYRYDRRVTLPTVFAHRDVGNITCSGDASYAQMNKTRSIIEKKYNTLISGRTDNEGPDGLIDLLAPQNKKNDRTAEDTDSQSTESTISSSTIPTISASVDTSTTSSSKKSPNVSSATPSTTSSPDSAALGTSNTSKPTDTTNISSAVMADSFASSAGEQNNSSPPSASDEQQKTQALETVSGAHSMLASVLGTLGTPGLGQTTDVILGIVRRSIENGPSIVDLPVLIGQIITINEQDNLAAGWCQTSEEIGLVLGYAMPGIQSGSTVASNAGQADALCYVKFPNGIITNSDTIGTHAIWGRIADEWARQGFEVGKLGTPTKAQAIDGNTERTEFQNGSIIFDHATSEVKTELK